MRLSTLPLSITRTMPTQIRTGAASRIPPAAGADAAGRDLDPGLALAFGGELAGRHQVRTSMLRDGGMALGVRDFDRAQLDWERRRIAHSDQILVPVAVPGPGPGTVARVRCARLKTFS